MMLVTMMKSKIHCATVTQAELNYMGSITIDGTLIKAAGLLPGEKVQIVNNNNGARLETYVIEGEDNSGTICLNGAAARMVQVGDIVIIISYALFDEAEAKNFQPKVVMVDQENHIRQCQSMEKHGEIGSYRPDLLLSCRI